MDSLTQLVLGAACGEIVLGRKIGNKALLFGAIGGTIPDLDVILGKVFYANSIDQLAFHRGVMHSILFAVLGGVLIGYSVFYIYNSGKRKHTTTAKDWIWLFFLSIFTHPILDSFTPYGTQLFLPFSNYRVAFNNISVADPFYTLPFLGCLIAILFFARRNPKRLFWLKAGVYISSVYMVVTLLNKLYIDTVFRDAFERANVTYSRFSTQPTILNNFLWYGIAETETDYKVAFYSIFDTKDPAENVFILDKNHGLINLEHHDIKTLMWFSNGYFNVEKMDSVTWRYNDLRYPLLNQEDKNSSVFSFMLKKNGERFEALPLYDKVPTKNDVIKFKERVFGN